MAGEVSGAFPAETCRRASVAGLPRPLWQLKINGLHYGRFLALPSPRRSPIMLFPELRRANPALARW